MTRVISVFSIKGGEGKTTLSIILADCLAKQNAQNKILLIDVDAQQSLTDHYLPPEDGNIRFRWENDSLAALSMRATSADDIDLSDKIIRDCGLKDEGFGQVDIIPAAPYDLSELQNKGVNYSDKVEGANKLMEKLKSPDFGYTHIIFDMPPAQPLTVLPYLFHSDICAIPLIPNVMSHRCLDYTLKVVREARIENPKIATRILFGKLRHETHSIGMNDIQNHFDNFSSDLKGVDTTICRDKSFDGIKIRSSLEFRKQKQKFQSKYSWCQKMVQEATQRILS